MNLENLKKILLESKVLIKDKPRNFLCKCIFCGDHKDKNKWGHLYVSKDEKIPCAHCWMCGHSISIPKLISELTGDRDKYREIITDEELNQNYNESVTKKISGKQRFKQYKLPSLNTNSFNNKKYYLRKRTNNLIDTDLIPNIILNFQEFFHVNRLDIIGENKQITNYEFDFLQNHYIGFLSEHHTLIYCRNCDESSEFKFRKIELQRDNYGMLDYWCIKKENPKLTKVVLSEGNFDILGEYVSDSLKIKDDVKIYAAGNTFSYDNLLESVCLDNAIYKASVVILSDSDKTKKDYNWFLKNYEHLIKDCKIYINKNKKDFGKFPQYPVMLL